MLRGFVPLDSSDLTQMDTLTSRGVLCVRAYSWSGADTSAVGNEAQSVCEGLVHGLAGK